LRAAAAAASAGPVAVPKKKFLFPSNRLRSENKSDFTQFTSVSCPNGNEKCVSGFNVKVWAAGCLLLACCVLWLLLQTVKVTQFSSYLLI